MRHDQAAQHTWDVAVIGSGFGGSVAALRLAQKGYRVVVLEAGRRWSPRDFPKTSWGLRRYLWMPALGLRGMQRMDLLRDALVLSGAGVGGGSLVYGNTLFWPMRGFFDHPTVARLGGFAAMEPFYVLAQRMMGTVPNPRLTRPDRVLQQVAEQYGRGDTFTPSPVGVFFGPSGKPAPDPYFLGEGPERVGCTSCGACFTGCRVGAKNTLDRTYLYLAERLGATVVADTRVEGVRPLDAPDGSDGYALALASTAPGARSERATLRAKRVVVAAGVMGTLRLLLNARERGDLPNLSDRIGRCVRTNSESIVGVRVRDSGADLSRGIAASSSVFPDPHTQIQADRYGAGSDSMAALTTLMVPGEGDLPRPLRWAMEVLRRPLEALRVSSPPGFATSTVILVVMQDHDSSFRLVLKPPGPLQRLPGLASVADDEGVRAPTHIPLGEDFAQRMAEALGGVPLSSITEVVLDAPVTAHILGGCAPGASPDEGTLDLQGRAWGYRNLWVCDGSVIPANLGANPALSILAFAERAMSYVPPKDGAPSITRLLRVDRAWNTAPLLHSEGNADGRITLTPIDHPLEPHAL